MTLSGSLSVGKPLAPTSAAEPVSDEELVGRLRDGDTAAGETLVGRFYPALTRYLHAPRPAMTTPPRNCTSRPG